MRFRLRNQKGASLIEFALIMPLLILLILGIVDAGWAFFQNLEVRHGAREAARLAAVDYGYGSANQTNEIIKATCERMSVPSGSAEFTVELAKTGSNIGDKATVTVSKPDHTSLTGLLPFFDHLNLSTTVEIRIEQPAHWSAATKTCAAAGW